MINQNTFRVVLSKPDKKRTVAPEEREQDGGFVRIEILRNREKFQAAMYTKTKVFHRNFGFDGVQAFVDEHFGIGFLQMNTWDGEYEYQTGITKKGKMISSRKKNAAKPGEFRGGTLNREKNTIIKEGDAVPALVEMGVFTKDLKIVSAMNDKFRQINRFLELIDDATKDVEAEKINVIDFGSGKSYLTFLVHYYFNEIRRIKVEICGLDSNKEVVETCVTAVKRFGLDSVRFLQGEIGKLEEPPFKGWGESGAYNIVVSLHACDTATDYAIFNAIKWQADLICAVPCCQHELRDQMKPINLKIFSAYGIIEERIASLATDAVRAKLLEYSGYKTHVIEFTPMENTPKNLFIRAIKTVSAPRKSALDEVNALAAEFGFSPTLLRLLSCNES